ncbi:MAG: phasin family protein [Rhodospirillales bacterium]|nr:phasin family protein [Rhodospirillales bacterium]MDH3792804.1 phasin family protein [Rhodospirillales bacterium]MDH3918719.1 phasin family protein [Rhodospirillales bacterium]MDH3968823.1 phasin family protein [Rhodospirillales bacterium]
MAQQAKQTSKTTQAELTGQLEQIAAFNGAAMDMISRAGQAYFNSVTALNEELMRFAALRMQHDAEFGQTLTKCQDWSAAAELQQGWVREASEEYFAEAGKLFELASKATIEGWKPVQKRATQALDDLQKTAP